VKTLTEEVNAAQGRLTDAAARGEDGWEMLNAWPI